MKQITDEQLILELKNRFEENDRSLSEVRELMEQLKEVNEKLSNSEKLKSHFLSNIRNEINNPVAAMLGLSHNLQTLESGDWDQMRSLAKHLYNETFNLDFQLKNIFAAAEIEAGEYLPEPVNVNFIKLIEGTVASYRHKFNVKKMDFFLENKVQEDDNKTFFTTDSFKLELVLSNLINNALEFSPEKSKIIIKVSRSSNQLQISVKDYGSGINEEDRKIIFDRFTQLDSRVIKAYKGHGLGLSISQALLESIEGEIRIESKPNEGTEFIISLAPLQKGLETADFTSEGNEVFFDEAESF